MSDIERICNTKQSQEQTLNKVRDLLAQIAGKAANIEITIPAGSVLSKTPDEAKARKEYEDVVATGKLPKTALEKPIIQDTIKNIAKNIVLDKFRGF